MRAQHAALGVMASPGRVAAAGKDCFPETRLSRYVSSLAVPGIFGALTWRADKSPLSWVGRYTDPSARDRQIDWCGPSETIQAMT